MVLKYHIAPSENYFFYAYFGNYYWIILWEYILYFNWHSELIIISGLIINFRGVCIEMSYSGKTLSSVSRRVADVRFRNKSTKIEGSDARRRANVWKKILDDVCDQCSLHGLNHIVGKDRSTGEKSVSTRKTKNIEISINKDMLMSRDIWIL